MAEVSSFHDTGRDIDPIKKLLVLYLNSPRTNEEFEVRFNTLRDSPRLTKIQFDNVIKYLLSRNFEKSSDEHTLKIQSHFTTTDGLTKISNLRTEIRSVPAIQEFCKTNQILKSDGNIKENISFQQKMPIFLRPPGTGAQGRGRGSRMVGGEDGDEDGDGDGAGDGAGDEEAGRREPGGTNSRIHNVDNVAFGFRVSYQLEEILKQADPRVNQVITEWADKKKLYRMVTRVSFTSREFPGLRVDCSVVRSSAKNPKGRMIPTYNVRESDVFEQEEEYEIEIEMIKSVVQDIRKYGGAMYGISGLVSSSTGSASAAASAAPDTDEEINAMLKKLIKYVLSGIQETNYPITQIELRNVQREYLSILYPKMEPEKMARRFIRSRDFVGPSSISLEIPNIAPITEDTLVPNIRIPYTVTDKADGQRKLLVISANKSTLGRVYLIDTNMNVQYTGCITRVEALFGTILDGEHILHDNSGRFINLYAAFDVYYVAGADQRAKPFFTANPSVVLKESERLLYLEDIVRKLTLLNDSGRAPAKHFSVVKKTFYYASGKPGEKSIFDCCRELMDIINGGSYSYKTDGLIFTPARLAVGSDREGETLEPVKKTWEYSFKWKPPQYNTVDFLVSTRRNPDGSDYIGNIFESGTDTTSMSQVAQYKTLVLKVGFDISKHGYVNPCEDIVQGRLPQVVSDANAENEYQPVPFYPTAPADPTAHLCNVRLIETPIGARMLAEETGDVIDNNMIVECRYRSEPDVPEGWRWVPIRVRFDKTAEFRRGLKNFGNAYHVANSVWHSIHNPISERMITTGEGIPEVVADDDVYYQRTGSSLTRPLRDFHNLYVKRRLIMGVASSRNDSLLDMGVGKAGDLPKWIAANIRFVLGIDIARDNIENRVDGACARYLNYRRRTKKMPDALFITGDCSENIRNGDALVTEKGKQIIKAVFGEGPRDAEMLGEGVYKQYGRVKNGFQVISSQFVIHYYFKTPATLFGFLRNLSECCSVGGYFVCTSYDGEKVFSLLNETPYGESVGSVEKDKKLWEITKKYTAEEFKDDKSSIGMQIDVYQETINKVFPEYLVNYNYLIRLMERFGFRVISKSEAGRMQLPAGTATFNVLYDQLVGDIKKEDRMKSGRGVASGAGAAAAASSGEPAKTSLRDEIGQTLDMEEHPGQKTLSFLNRYAVFIKDRDVDAIRVQNELIAEIEGTSGAIEAAASSLLQNATASSVGAAEAAATSVAAAATAPAPTASNIIRVPAKRPGQPTGRGVPRLLVKPAAEGAAAASVPAPSPAPAPAPAPPAAPAAATATTVPKRVAPRIAPRAKLNQSSSSKAAEGSVEPAPVAPSVPSPAAAAVAAAAASTPAASIAALSAVPREADTSGKPVRKAPPRATLRIRQTADIAAAPVAPTPAPAPAPDDSAPPQAPSTEGATIGGSKPKRGRPKLIFK